MNLPLYWETGNISPILSCQFKIPQSTHNSCALPRPRPIDFISPPPHQRNPLSTLAVSPFVLAFKVPLDRQVCHLPLAFDGRNCAKMCALYRRFLSSLRTPCRVTRRCWTGPVAQWRCGKHSGGRGLEFRGGAQVVLIARYYYLRGSTRHSHWRIILDRGSVSRLYVLW